MLATFLVASAAVPVHQSALPNVAQRFISYYQASAWAPEPMSFVERVTYSYLLARAHSNVPEESKRASR